MTRPKSPILVMLALLFPALAAAAIITVSPDGPLTIQAALDLAQDGDVVELRDGVFTGPGNRDLDFAGKAITLRSQGADPLVCVIDSEGSDLESHRAIHFQAEEGPGTVIEGLTIRGGWHSWSGGILAEVYCTPVVRRCRFVANVGTEGGGLCTKDAMLVEDCLFEDNFSSSHGGGASAAGNLGYASTFLRCTFVNNEAGVYGGAFRC
jgi:hypothetical protein